MLPPSGPLASSNVRDSVPRYASLAVALLPPAPCSAEGLRARAVFAVFAADRPRAAGTSGAGEVPGQVVRALGLVRAVDEVGGDGRGRRPRGGVRVCVQGNTSTWPF